MAHLVDVPQDELVSFFEIDFPDKFSSWYERSLNALESLDGHVHMIGEESYPFSPMSKAYLNVNHKRKRVEVNLSGAVLLCSKWESLEVIESAIWRVDGFMGKKFSCLDVIERGDVIGAFLSYSEKEMEERKRIDLNKKITEDRSKEQSFYETWEQAHAMIAQGREEIEFIRKLERDICN